MSSRLVKGVMLSAAVFLSARAFAQTAPGPAASWGYGTGMGMGSGWGWSHMIFGFGMMVLFWGGLILLVVLAVRAFRGSSSREAPPPEKKAPLDILKERFARGEIDKEEFEERKRLLSD